VRTTYDRWLAGEPGNAALLYLRGRLEASLTQQLHYYERALQADANNAHAWFGKCLALESRGELSSALSACQRSSVLDPQRLPVWLKRLELYHARGEPKKVEEELRAIHQQFGAVDAVHQWLLAHNVLAGKPEAARALHGRYAEWCARQQDTQPLVSYWAVTEAASAAALHYLLGEYDAHVRVIQESPVAVQWGFTPVFGALQLGDYAAVAQDVPALPQPEGRGFVFLLASIGVAGHDGQQPNAFWQQAAQEFTASKLPMEATLANLLARSAAPALREVDDLATDPIVKATLLVALAQRFPTLREPALQRADTFAATPFPPGPFLRTILRDIRADITAR
jgi:hypothetical protein